uniref:uncharacterized protein LOC120347527 isoform X1 n=1 Tax=Styela clava TaxID=7725 RepID=UPI00193994D9|nr:uncharacterized protein LOC120347527 isoform X1 [Styela clava]
MRRYTRPVLRMKARYLITIVLLIGITSFITWMQSGEVTDQTLSKSSHDEEQIQKQPQIKTRSPKSKNEQPVVVQTPDLTILPKKEIVLRPPISASSWTTLSPISELEKQEYYNEFFKSSAFQSTDRKQKQSNGNFLLPVLFFDVGPNNLYRLFKETIPIAKAMERTLVVPPFHRHPRMENYVRGKRIGKENSQTSQSDRVIEVPIFDQTYVVGLETNPSKSLDMKALRYFVPVESMDKFTKGCSEESKTLLVCGELDEKRRKGIQLFITAAKLKFTKTVHVESFSDIIENKTWKINLASANEQLEDSKCAGLAIGRGCLGSKEAWLKQYKSISPFIRRPVPVKILAKKFISDMMSNQDFLAIHWRYDQIDWNDMCKPTRPESARKRNAQICELASKLDSEEGALLQMGKKIVRYMRKRGLRKAYLAGPPQMNDTIHKLRAKTPGLFTIHDVREYAATRRSSTGFFETNYMMSFLEQEICYLSKTFLASPLSSWSQSVLLDRMSEGRSTFESVLDVLVDGIPGLPKLTWLFPEGSWR